MTKLWVWPDYCQSGTQWIKDASGSAWEVQDGCNEWAEDVQLQLPLTYSCQVCGSTVWSTEVVTGTMSVEDCVTVPEPALAIGLLAGGVWLWVLRRVRDGLRAMR